MITDTDITKLKTVFATKEALADLRVEVGELREEMNDRIDSLEVKVDTVLSKIDAFVGAVHEVREDNAAGAVMLYRHERHIQALADKAGITLPRVE